MQLLEIVGRLKDIVSFLKPFNDESTNIDNFRLLQNGQTQFTSGCLYIGTISALPLHLPLTEAAFLCVEDIPLSKVNKEINKLNLCIANGNISHYEILSNISEIMNEEIRLALFMQKLLDVVYSNQGLQHLIDTAREVFGHPMLIHDTSFKVIALSYDAGEVIDFQQDTNGDKYIDVNTIEDIRNNNVFAQIHRHGLSQYVEKAEPLHGTFVSLILIEGIEVAQLAVYEAGKQFQKIDFKLMDRFNKLVSVELQKNDIFNINKNLIPNYILSDLLDKKYSDEDTVNHRFHYLKWTKSNTLSIMVIANREIGSFDIRIPFIIQSLKTFIPADHCIIYKSDLVVFLDDALIQTLLESKDSKFTEYLESNLLYAGLSLQFSKLAESRKYYFQALKAKEIGQRYNHHLSTYENCTTYIIADLVSSQYDPMDFCHPAVIQLAKGDRENSTDLLKTLKYYIYFTNHANEAAKTLCIHRNTLFYRINRIKQLTGITLENAEEIFKIYVSIRLLEINSGGTFIL